MRGCPTRRAYVWGFWYLYMPKGLKRYYGRGDLHFLTFSCYRRRQLLGTTRARNLFVKELGGAGIQADSFLELRGRNGKDVSHLRR